MTATSIRRQRWRDRAACRDADTNLFFPPEEGGKAQARKAKAICAGCPVRAECLESAEEFGIWGGTAERERHAGRVPAASGYQGVTFNRQAGKWAARVRRDGRLVHIGLFPSPSAAGDAVREAGGYIIPQPGKAVA